MCTAADVRRYVSGEEQLALVGTLERLQNAYEAHKRKEPEAHGALERALTQCDESTTRVVHLADKIAKTPAKDIAGLAVKLRIAAHLMWIEQPDDFQTEIVRAVVADAERLAEEGGAA